MTVYPTDQEVLDVHAEFIDLFGGTHEVRDSSAILSALAPQSGYYSDLAEEAAALWGSHRVSITVRSRSWM